ncbi:MAG: M4 family metallopeptidase, partial [Vicingaceae bacterium]|nr:M4 family metallopeptidase [Vicingaceae bacterium]
NLIKEEKDHLGYSHYRFQQTINGIPVKFGIYIAHIKNGLIESVNGELMDDVNSLTTPLINESSALNLALNHFGAQTYKWELAEEEYHLKIEQNDPSATFYPKGELMMLNDKGNINSKLKLVYAFNIYAQEPFGRRRIYVDGINGDIVWEENLIHEADVVGAASTLYSGTQDITCDNAVGPFRLRESGRGNGIRTFDMGYGTSYGGATDIVNSSATWSVPQGGLDAHWGSEMTYDYFLNVHGRNSIDGNGFILNSYVSFDNNFSNAFWDGQRMTYGDGNGNNTPYTALDIAGHEITHGLTTNTANLVYQDESGALNESFSDIFGISIEFVAKPSQANWELGEDLGFVIRNMQNPNAEGDPDTYFGTNWAPLGGPDNGGVHSNSGVQNFWYYLLVNGGSGTNDNGDSYTVNGIGLTDASKIAFRNLTIYLTPSSNYNDARFFAIQSAIDLFGGCSSEVESVTNAWYAVGLGSVYVPSTVSDFTASSLESCVAPFTVQFTNTGVNGTGFFWDFGDGTPTVTTPNPQHTYTTTGSFTVQLSADGGAACGTDTETKASYININSSIPCVTVLPSGGNAQTQTGCDGTLFDSGGAVNDYGNNQNSFITISPAGASSVDLTFVSFDIEPGSSSGVCDYDYLEIYDGPNVSSPLIDRYCNENIPTTISSTGGAVTLRFHSDPFVGGSGFQVNWTCNGATGIDDINGDSKMITYVNANNNLELSLNNLAMGNYNLVLYNAVGQKVIGKQINISSDIQKERVSLSGVTDGIYYLNLSNENDNYTSKLVK